MPTTSYNDLNQYPANPYIQQNWWTGPQPSAGGWSQQAFSPEFNQARQQTYGWYQNAMQNLPSMAGMYQGYLEQSPQLEQATYNQALSRLKGQYGTAMQNLNTGAGAIRGGNRGGALQAGVQDLNRQLMQGTMDIATNQAMQNLADRERRQQQLIGYTGQDISNRLGVGQAMQGWLGQQFPIEQYGVNAPYERALAEEQVNAQRRGEGMGWLNTLMNYQNMLANQYYTGQGNWLGYTGMRGQNILGGYTPQWLGWTQAYM